jgi:hypothetical protein
LGSGLVRFPSGSSGAVPVLLHEKCTVLIARFAVDWGRLGRLGTPGDAW